MPGTSRDFNASYSEFMSRNQSVNRATVELAPRHIPEGPRASLNAVPPPPCQTPFEFAHRNEEISIELNRELRNLRFRLFGDDCEQDPDAVKEGNKPLERLIQSANYQLGEAFEQVKAIHSRL